MFVSSEFDSLKVPHYFLPQLNLVNRCILLFEVFVGEEYNKIRSRI